MKIVIIGFLMIFIISLGYSAVKSVSNGVLFTYDAPNAENVYIAGSFNDWNASKDKLTKNKEGIWEIILKLSPGKYQYKFVVDGNWYFDQDNPDTEDDGYGGANSVIEIDNNGKLKIASSNPVAVRGIKSIFNPKVYFTGRYYTQNDFIKDKRYYLNKPVHNLNFGIKVKLNPNFVAFTLLNIDNNVENTNMWKTHLNYKKSWVKLNTPVLKITAFDNTALFTSDDPLHIIGNQGKNHYDFGLERRGVLISTKKFNEDMKFIDMPLSVQGQLLYSDQAGSDENDINFGKIILNFDKNTDNNGYKINSGMAFLTYHKRESESMRKRHQSHEIDFTLDKYLYQSHWADFMKLSFRTEYLNFINSDVYDDFGSDPYIIASSYDWMNGDKTYFGFRAEFPRALKVNTYFTTNTVNFYKLYDNDIYTPSQNLKKASIKRNLIDFNSDFNIENLSLNIDLSFWQTDYPDSLVNWADYFAFMEYNNGTGKWFDSYSYFSFDKLTLLGYKTALLWKTSLWYQKIVKDIKLEMNFKSTFAQQNFFKQPKYSEIISSYRITYKKYWSFLFNNRLAAYNDRVLNIKTDFETGENLFVDSYLELSYHLKKNVSISLGYGMNPEYLDEVSDNFYQGGRYEYLSEYSDYEKYLQSGYKGVSEKIIDAEKALEKCDMISIRAKLVF